MRSSLCHGLTAVLRYLQHGLFHTLCWHGWNAFALVHFLIAKKKMGCNFFHNDEFTRAPLLHKHFYVIHHLGLHCHTTKICHLCHRQYNKNEDISSWLSLWYGTINHVQDRRNNAEINTSITFNSKLNCKNLWKNTYDNMIK